MRHINRVILGCLSLCFMLFGSAYASANTHNVGMSALKITMRYSHIKQLFKARELALPQLLYVSKQGFSSADKILSDAFKSEKLIRRLEGYLQKSISVKLANNYNAWFQSGVGNDYYRALNALPSASLREAATEYVRRHRVQISPERVRAIKQLIVSSQVVKQLTQAEIINKAIVFASISVNKIKLGAITANDLINFYAKQYDTLEKPIAQQVFFYTLYQFRDTGLAQIKSFVHFFNSTIGNEVQTAMTQNAYRVERVAFQVAVAHIKAPIKSSSL